jgi:hypothetical protein
MRNISLLRKFGFYRLYKKTIRENSVEIESTFKLRIDDAKRLYTVLNIPEEFIGEAYALKKSDVDKISENYIREYSNELANYLNSKGLAELYRFYEVRKVDKYSYLLVIGFSMFRSDERRVRIVKYWIPSIISVVVLTALVLLLI